MKKVSVALLGVILLLAFAAGALAETKVEFGGNYRTRYHYQHNMLLLGEGFDKSQDSHFDQRFRQNVKFMPNDKLTMYFAVEALNTHWGADVNNVSGLGARSTGTNGYYANSFDGSVYVRYAYFDVNTDYGLFSLGRQSIGVEGLSMMGYTFPGFIGNDVFDSERPGDRFKWIYEMGSLKLGFAYDKILELDSQLGTTVPPTAKNADTTDYIGFADYRFNNGGLWFSYTYFTDGSNSQVFVPALPARFLVTTHSVNPAGFVTFGPVNIGAELRYMKGHAEVAGDYMALDLEGLGVYVDGTYNFGPGSVGLQYAWFQGDNDLGDNKAKGRVASGADFTPFLIMYEIGVTPQVANFGGQGLSNTSNHWMLGLHGNYSVTENLALHAALGYFKINEAAPGWSRNFGTELNFDLKYKIMDNLDYILNLGYFWAGDYLKGGANDLKNDNAWAMRHEVTLSW